MAKVIDATMRLVDQFTPTLRAVDSAIKSNESTMKAATNATKGAGTAMKSYAKDMQEAEKINQRVSKSVQGMGKSINNAAKKLAMLSAGLAAAATEGIKYHAEYEDGMAKVSTAIDRNVVSLQGLSDGLRMISDETGRSVLDLSAAEYQALSANVDSAHATEFMMAATKASIAGFADSTTAIDGLTTVLNAYGLKTEEVGRISDQMIAAQSLGKTTFNEIALSIGGVATSASMAGIQTEELLASIDSITKKGVKTPEAITQIQGMITAIQKQSKQTQKAAQSISMDFSEAHLKAVGYANFMAELKEKSGGDSTILTHLFGRVEAVNGFKELTADMGDFNNTLGKIKNSSGATAEAFDAMMTPAQKTRIAMNQLKNAGMDLGAGMAPILKRTTVILKSLANTLNAMSPAQKEMLVDIVQFVVIGTIGLGVLGKVVTGFGSAFGMVTKFASAITTAGGVLPLLAKGLTSIVGTLEMVSTAMKMMFLNPWGIAIMVIIGLIYLLYTHWDMVSAYLSKTFGGLGEKVGAVVDKIVGYWHKFMAVSGDSSTAIGKYMSYARTVLSLEWSIICAVFNTAINLIGNLLDTLGSIINIMIGGALDNFGFFIDFIVGVFTGDWQGAWTAVVNIFSNTFGTIAAIANTVLGGVKNAINDVIGGINNISVDIPDWVPGVGGQHYQPSIPMLAKGTDNWQGGTAMIHDAGAEIVDLPQGSRVIPHDKSLKNEYERGKTDGTGNGKGFNIIIQNMSVREESDINKIATALAQKLESHAMNQAIGAF
jgi:phage tail tape measure protein, TP901 family, core region